MVQCSTFEELLMPVTFCKDNQGAIILSLYPQIQPRTKHIAIKYYHFRSFVANGDIKINHVNTKGKLWIFYEGTRI